eukprot:ANDGO_06661.mRNA.1 hypothetical protein
MRLSQQNLRVLNPWEASDSDLRQALVGFPPEKILSASYSAFQFWTNQQNITQNQLRSLVADREHAVQLERANWEKTVIEANSKVDMSQADLRQMQSKCEAMMSRIAELESRMTASGAHVSASATPRSTVSSGVGNLLRPFALQKQPQENAQFRALTSSSEDGTGAYTPMATTRAQASSSATSRTMSTSYSTYVTPVRSQSMNPYAPTAGGGKENQPLNMTGRIGSHGIQNSVAFAGRAISPWGANQFAAGSSTTGVQPFRPQGQIEQRFQHNLRAFQPTPTHTGNTFAL